MFGFGKRQDDEYTRGYEASHEFSELVDDSVTDEQLRQQWNIVETNHSPEYVEGYEQYVRDELDRPWWKLW